MTHSITVPKLGLMMEEGTLVQWHCADGERVEKGQALFAIETEKIVTDVEADADGFFQRAAEVNATLPVGALVGYLHPSAAAALAAPKPGQAEPASALTIAVAPTHAEAPKALSRSDGARLQITPVARRIAVQQGLDPAAITGSGQNGVIRKRDVEAATSGTPVQHAEPVRSAPDPSPSTRKPLSGMRRAIARRMTLSLATSAQMTGFGTVDMTATKKWREALVKESDRLGARITITDIVIKAAAAVLAEMPEINSYIDGDEIVTWTAVNIGFAVALDDGLIIPVVHNADRLKLVEISRLRAGLIDKARAGKLNRDEVEGGTFSLSNFGSYGGDFETPILASPQSALLGIGQITDQAVVRDGQIVIRAMMSMSLTFDHRLIDGAVAGHFRSRFKALLEEPALWMATMV